MYVLKRHWKKNVKTQEVKLIHKMFKRPEIPRRFALDRRPPAVIHYYDISHTVLTIFFSIYIYFSGSEATPRTTDGYAWTS